MSDRAAIAAMAPTGTLRVAINTGNAILTRPGPIGQPPGQPPQYPDGPPDGRPGGLSVDLARALAAGWGLPLRLTAVPNAAASVALVSEGRVDLGFFAVDPARAATVAFSDPWVLIEGWYLVRRDAPIVALDQVDRPGHRIAVGRGSAYDLHLSRTIDSARLERVTTSQEVVDFALREGFEVAAGIRQQLEADQRRHPGLLRLLPERFMVIPQALGVPAGREPAVLALLNAALSEARRSGRIAAMMARDGTEGAVLP